MLLTFTTRAFVLCEERPVAQAEFPKVSTLVHIFIAYAYTHTHT